MRSARLLALVVALVLPPLRAASAQRPAYAASLPADFDSVTTASLLRELERASGRGLPVEPLLAKAREGRLKRAPGPRIRQAVSALSMRLDTARSALGPDASSDELVAGADALAAGAGADALRAVRGAGARGTMAVPLGALAQLVASGVSQKRATAMIVDLIRRNTAPAVVVAFGNAVESDAAGGLPADEAALFRMRAASGGVSTSLLEAQSASATSPPGANMAGTPPKPPSSSPPRRRP
jgi:hypothetical protein